MTKNIEDSNYLTSEMVYMIDRFNENVDRDAIYRISALLHLGDEWRRSSEQKLQAIPIDANGHFLFFEPTTMESYFFRVNCLCSLLGFSFEYLMKALLESLSLPWNTTHATFDKYRTLKQRRPDIAKRVEQIVHGHLTPLRPVEKHFEDVDSELVSSEHRYFGMTKTKEIKPTRYSFWTRAEAQGYVDLCKELSDLVRELAFRRDA